MPFRSKARACNLVQSATALATAMLNSDCYTAIAAAMYVCQLCDHFAAPSYSSVLRHIGAVHSHDASFRIHCGIESCPRVLRNYHSFRRHLRKKHNFLLQTGLGEDEEQPVDATVDSVYAENGSESVETIGEGGVRHEASAGEEKRVQAMYILKLKEKYKLAQTTVDNIIDDTEGFSAREVARVVSLLRQQVTAVLSKEGLFPEEICGFAEVFENPDILKPPFSGLHTQYFQEKYFRENLGLVVGKKNVHNCM